MRYNANVFPADLSSSTAPLSDMNQSSLDRGGLM